MESPTRYDGRDGDDVIRVDARFGYEGRVAAEAELRVHAGEVVALLGPNGSGKTTLLKGTLGLVERLSGTVQLFGHAIEQLEDRSRIGYVPQRQGATGPIPVTVTELVRSGQVRSGRLAARRGSGQRRANADTAIRDAIETVGLTPLSRATIAALSGGQQRRALVARALAGGADVLLLDEPLAGVDQVSQQALADSLAGLVARGATVVVVLHELGPLESLITRAVCMDGGRARFDGPIDTAPAHLLHLGHDHDPHGGPPARTGMGLTG